jgi:hypothetical protein
VPLRVKIKQEQFEAAPVKISSFVILNVINPANLLLLVFLKVREFLYCPAPIYRRWK